MTSGKVSPTWSDVSLTSGVKMEGSDKYTVFGVFDKILVGA